VGDGAVADGPERGPERVANRGRVHFFGGAGGRVGGADVSTARCSHRPCPGRLPGSDPMVGCGASVTDVTGDVNNSSRFSWGAVVSAIGVGKGCGESGSARALDRTSLLIDWGIPPAPTTRPAAGQRPGRRAPPGWTCRMALNQSRTA